MEPREPSRADPATVSDSILPEDDPRVSAALEAYLAHLRRGERPDRSAFLREHADVADILGPCLEGLELVHTAARDLPFDEAAAELSDVVLPPASQLGDYRVLRVVGRGGMGVVYEAHQVSLGRRVALKVLPIASALDPRQLQRFRIEAQAAALLHHPHIVPIFAVGSDRGLHYYAMQFIEGPTLADVVRSLASAPSEDEGRPPSSIPTASGLTPSGREKARAVARIGQQAADALDHAHTLGVLHRDVKPSNLMIDAQGDLWVTDFGLARVAANSDLTRTGDLLGTLRYASPEQASGRPEVDHRTDVYSLGVTLYELLTLRPAFGASDRHELLRAITHDEPAPPRRIDPTIPRDLETIILKAMAKEPAARYRSARELADDLGRFLADRAIHARRPGPLELAARWSRRHRPIVLTAGTVILVALAASSALLWFEQRRTRDALAALQAARTRERRALDLAFTETDQLLYPLMGKAAFGGLLTGAEGRQTYNDAIAFYERFAKMFADDPEGWPIIARTDRRIGFFRMINRDPRAHDSYRRAIMAYENLVAGKPSDIDYRLTLLSILEEYASWLHSTDRADQSRSYIVRGLELVEGWPRPYPTSPHERMQVAGAKNTQAWRMVTQANYPVTDPARALALARDAVELEPGFADFWNTLGLVEYRSGDLEAAREALRRSMDLQKQGGSAHDWLILAMVRHRQGESADARRWLDQARAWMKDHPDQVKPDMTLLDREAAALIGEQDEPPAPGPGKPAD